MLRKMKQVAATCVMALAVAVISLPNVAYSATSPAVTVMEPIKQGLLTPGRLVLDAVGNIYVADLRARSIVRMDPSGTQQLGIIKTATIPNGIGIAQDGTLLVAQGSFVARYDVSTGVELGRLTGGQLQNAFSIAVDDQTGYIYVVDTKADQVEIYNAEGSFVKAFAKGAKSDANGATITIPVGKLSGPTGITFEKISRQFAIADTTANRVQFFDVDGNFIKSIGIPLCGTATTICTSAIQPMQFVMPVAIAFEYTKGATPTLSRMYIADGYTANIKVVDPSNDSALNVAGTSKNTIGVSGLLNGQLMSPTDLVFDNINSRLLVADTSIGNITVYGIDGGATPVFSDITPPTLTVDPVLATVNVPNITVTGTAEAGSKVTLSADGTAVVGNVIFTTSTTWKSDITGLLPGLNTISVIATDYAGNSTAPKTASTTYIELPPQLTLSSSVPSITTAYILDLNGTVDAGSTVTIINGLSTVISSATVLGSEWSYKAILTEGSNSISIVAQKNSSEKSTITVNTSLDTTAPILTVSAIADNSNTGTQVQNIAGTVSDTNIVTVSVNDISATLVDNSFTVPVTLVAGLNTVKVTATDLAGNISTNIRNINFDSTAPQLTISSPMDNSSTNNSLIQVSGTVDESSTVMVAGLQATVENNIWTASVSLIPGLNTVEVIATDLAGNISSQKRTISLDTDKPIIAISNPVQDKAVNESTINIAGTLNDANISLITYSINGTVATSPAVDGKFEFVATFTKDGVYPIAITVVDAAGNSSTATRTIIYDTVAPKLTVNRLYNDIISGTVELGATIKVLENNDVLKNVKITSSGTKWIADLHKAHYNKNKISVVATDAAGNSTTIRLKKSR